MSAAATAAGYLYASGRLRGKREEETSGPQSAAPERKRVRVAVLPEREPSEIPAAPRPKRVPRVEYRVRRWRPTE
jgi:hypothetical protein